MIDVGDQVGYSRDFLRSCELVTSVVPFARGIVTKLEPIGTGWLARVDWGVTDLPPWINVVNLARVQFDHG